ncbi:torsin-1A-like [Dreissena polymorpha]|uniref:Uncharacterized protein n=1 Tax=Dreissena polymorpha TaxID=45954 RepID=A0A9D4EG96_DREPO|nr:torsin-1A-like [Dreissena polymorpha]XP_052229717.1 torsin-1A-like [Dreissena polymorpha]XP_052229718.1 torsin-1A-like [Dreissena polymorpha]KAH3778076.1 hypothetical protein DPMN_179529 [Dreissena polymorpha]
MDQEEAMELSGESNLVSNLHNFSFDVSWSTGAREVSPPIERRRFTTVLSPARFVPHVGSHVAGPRVVLQERPLNCSTPTVKVSQKGCYGSQPSPVVMASADFSPMEVDKENSYVSEREPGTKLRKRHSDFGVSYSSAKSESPERGKPRRSMLVIPEQGAPYREPAPTGPPASSTSPLEDSVFHGDQGNIRKLNPSKPQTVKSRPTKLSRSHASTSSLSSSFLEGNKRSSTLALLMAILLISAGLAAYYYSNLESCEIFDMDLVKLRHKLEDNVFGQHIAVKTILDTLETFKHEVNTGRGQQSLVMSFHGWTGIGKNYVSRFIAEAFFHSKVSLFIAPLHFVRLTDNLEGKDTLKKWIIGNITYCGVSVLIFDEIDKAAPSHLQAILEVLVNLRSNVGAPADVSKQHSSPKSSSVPVFLFLSNSKASQINSYLFSQMVLERQRDLIRKAEFDDIFEGSHAEWFNEFRSAGLIDSYVPFLPLAEGHVKQCIERDFIAKGRDPTHELVTSVMEELSFFEMGGKHGQISLTGCKRVSDKVDLHLED